MDSGSYIWPKKFFLLLSNLLMLGANLIVVLIIFIFGFYFSNSWFFQRQNKLSSKYEVLLHLYFVIWQIFYKKSNYKRYQI